MDNATQFFGFQSKPEDNAQPKKRPRIQRPAVQPPACPPPTVPHVAPSSGDQQQPKPKPAKRSRPNQNKNAGGVGGNQPPAPKGLETPAAAAVTTPPAEATPAAAALPQAEVTLITFAELLQFPDEAEAARGPVKLGQGKRSADEMKSEDDAFLAERRSELKSIGDFSKVPAEDTAAYCTAKVRICSTCLAKCTTKLGSLKRRKDDSSAATTIECRRIQKTAGIFQTLYSSLSSEAAAGTTLSEVIKLLETNGYTFSSVVHFKQVNFLVLDHLRFVQFPRLVASFACTSEPMLRLSKQDEDEGVRFAWRVQDGGCTSSATQFMISYDHGPQLVTVLFDLV